MIHLFLPLHPSPTITAAPPSPPTTHTRSGAQVVGLRPCTRLAVEKIKEAEENKQKTYVALCWAGRPLVQVCVGGGIIAAGPTPG